MADINPNARTDATAVAEIFDTDLTPAQLNAFINTAHTVVQNNLLNKGLNEETLTQIELWLSAHYACVLDPRVERESVGREWSATYQGKTDKGFESTFYGQHALTLDSSHTLTKLGKVKKASMNVHTTADGDNMKQVYG